MIVDESNDPKQTSPSVLDNSRPLHPHAAVVDLEFDLTANQRLDILIHVQPGGDEPVVQVTQANILAPVPQPVRQPRLPALTLQRISLDRVLANTGVLFGLAFIVYLMLQFVRLPSFPIYFFCDEAVNPVLASDFIRDGFRNYDGVFFPTFFKNGGQYCLGTTVYMQMVAFVLFGKSIWVTRGLFVFVSSLTAVFLAFISRDIFKHRYWWSAPLWLAAVPTWFLHARSAFEYAPMVAFYTGFLYFYLRYRLDKPWMLYPALIMGALAFYTYTPAQLIMVVTGLLLLISDWRYHIQHWRIAVRAAALLLILAAPLVRFWLLMPDEYSNRLSLYGSYWASEISTIQKIANYFGIYVSGLNPLYWFFAHSYDNPIHTMKGYGHIHWLMLAPFLMGLFQALRRWKAPEMRVLLLALLAAPAGTAMAMLHVNRALSMVIVVIMLGMIGFHFAVDWLQQRRAIRLEVFGAGMAVFLALFSIFMTHDALKNGPIWYSNYGLSGMQWGAQQVYAAAKQYIRRYPDRTLYISPNWTFQSEVVREYFAPGEPQIRIGATDAVISSVDPGLDQKAFVLMPEEYERIKSSGRFQEALVDKIIPYPDGRPGFYFVRLTYVDSIEEIIRAEQKDRQRIHVAEVMLAGQRTTLRHTAVEGDINNLFDDDADTLIKTRGINPLVLELEFTEPLKLSGITARVGAEPVEITVEVNGDGGGRKYTTRAGELGPYKDVPVIFSQVEATSRMRISLLDVFAPETGIVHIWELSLDFAR